MTRVRKKFRVYLYTFRGLLLRNTLFNTACTKGSLYLILSISCLENHKDVPIRHRFDCSVSFLGMPHGLEQQNCILPQFWRSEI